MSSVGAVAEWQELRVNDPAHSSCGSASLAQLDFSNWWTDVSFGKHYLHVQHRSQDTVHRVYCRHEEQPRLKMVGGELHWLVEKPKKTTR